MTALLLFVALEVPVVAVISVWVIHRMLLSHQTILAAVIGRRASDLAHSLSQAEDRVTSAATLGVRARSGPARLRD